MKYFLSIIFVFAYCSAQSQKYILPDGEYMDTTYSTDINCKDYNAYYYQVKGKYPKNSATILKEVLLFLEDEKRIYSGSGYITFRFVIDCQGNLMPKVQVLQTDEKYKDFHFDKNLVTELYNYLVTLKKWTIAKLPNGEPFLYRAFLTFKIQNGKVINIIP